jgi:hypothetical protein
MHTRVPSIHTCATYIHAHTCTYAYTICMYILEYLESIHIHTYIHIHTHVHMHTRVPNIHTYTRICMHIHMYICIPDHKASIWTCFKNLTCIHTNIHMHACIHKMNRECAHVHMHTRLQSVCNDMCVCVCVLKMEQGIWGKYG